MRTKLITLAAVTLAVSSAQAHVGDHSQQSLMALVTHLFAHPSHGVFGLLLFALSLFAVQKLRKPKAVQRRVE